MQLGAVAVFTLIAILFLDNQFRVLPTAIHGYMPAHHAGYIITDVTITKCSSINVFSSCKVDGENWHRIEKDLYLGSGYVSSAYVHVERKKEDEFLPDDKVVLDITIGRLDPSVGMKGEGDERWEKRPSGLWLKRTSKKQASDSNKAVTAIDVLFGADAVDPREGWEIKDTALLLGSAGEGHEARISIKRGSHVNHPQPKPRVGENGKFKILQVADLHLSTGLGICRDAMPEGYNGGRCDADPRTLEFIGKMLDEEKPDLVILSGDQVNGETAPDAQTVGLSLSASLILLICFVKAIFKYAELFIKRKIPYASIMGNHDDEGSLPRAGQMALIETLPYSLSEAGPEDVEGVGNYVVEVLARGGGTHSALTIYLLDTHAYSPDERSFKGYDWVKKSQIDWFKETAENLKKKHGQYSGIHMNLAFIHIPLPEYRDAESEYVGEWREAVTAPTFNSGFHKALLEEDVKFVSAGQ